MTKIVKSKEDLADFVESLRQDLLQDPDSWENPTLESYLDAMASWIRSMDHYRRNAGLPPAEIPDWSIFADILSAAKIYE
ncbi:MAG: hypothetical protein WA702_30450 [Bradyrhizobium sp.]|jgi:hypothetical protein|uniref:DUF7660 family protein n=1 Tax=Bradyrhizobium sp. TaxID=376 RepID=UPI003C7B0DCE